MKLLICTQAMDKNHPILGFFHRWVEEFAKHCEVVHVICLIEGEHSLPANVHVHSLGKEHGKNRLRELWRFYRLVWQLRHQYDSVFVHMNQIYVILGAPLWRLLGKRIGLWYMHGKVSFSLRMAEKLTHIIFTGSPESFRLQSHKLKVTGHGIDTDVFSPVKTNKVVDLITVGRIMPSKNIELLVESLVVIRKTHDVKLTIVGKASSPVEVAYKRKLSDTAVSLGVAEAIVWHDTEPHSRLPRLLCQSRVFVHAATNGSLDKAVLEAMAVEIPVITCAEGVRSLPLVRHTEATAEAMAVAIRVTLEAGDSVALFAQSQYVAQNHSILSLIPKIVTSLKPVS